MPTDIRGRDAQVVSSPLVQRERVLVDRVLVMAKSLDLKGLRDPVDRLDPEVPGCRVAREGGLRLRGCPPQRWDVNILLRRGLNRGASSIVSRVKAVLEVQAVRVVWVVLPSKVGVVLASQEGVPNHHKVQDQVVRLPKETTGSLVALPHTSRALVLPSLRAVVAKPQSGLSDLILGGKVVLLGINIV